MIVLGIPITWNPSIYAWLPWPRKDHHDKEDSPIVEPEVLSRDISRIESQQHRDNGGDTENVGEDVVKCSLVADGIFT